MQRSANIYILLPKIAYEKSKLLALEDYKILLTAKDLNEFVLRLKELEYGTLEYQGTLTLEFIDFQLKEILLATFHKIIRNSPQSFKKLLISYLLKYEMENVKALVKSIHKKLEKTEIMLHESVEKMLGHMDIFREGMSAPDLKALITILQKLPYGKIMKEAFAILERENYSFFYFDLFLDLKYLEELWNNYRKLSHKNASIAKKFVGFETDCYNLEAIIRAKNLKLEPYVIYRMISSKRYRLNKQFLEEMIKDTWNYQKLQEKFKIKEQITSIDAQTIYNLCKNSRLHLVRSFYIKGGFNIGKSLAFLLHKELEMENLRIISIGIQYKKPVNEISKKLYIV